MSARTLTRLALTPSGEVIVSAELSKTAIKKLIKEYARFGFDLVEVSP